MYDIRQHCSPGALSPSRALLPNLTSFCVSVFFCFCYNSLQPLNEYHADTKKVQTMLGRLLSGLIGC